MSAKSEPFWSSSDQSAANKSFVLIVKVKNKVVILVILFLFAALIASIYFVGGMSAFYDPIKKYESRYSAEQLIQKINLYCSTHHNITLQFEDTVGNVKNGYAFHYNVFIKSNLHRPEYNLRFENVTDTDHRKSEISLIGAFDLANKSGGYKLSDSGVKKLIVYFENHFIDSLNNVQDMDIREISDH